MTYNKNNVKAWSINAVAAKERKRLDNSETREFLEDDHIVIEIKRRRTGEHIVMDLHQGSRCDSYRVYVDGKPFKNPKNKSGERGISDVGRVIAKALPRFMSESNF